MEADWIHDGLAISTEREILYVPSIFETKNRKGGILALSTKSGEPIWFSSFSAAIQSTPLVVKQEGKIFVGGEDGLFSALDQKNGEKLWVFQTGGAIKDQAVYNNLTKQVIFSSFDGYVYALSSTKGTLEWKSELGSANFSSPFLWKEKILLRHLINTFTAWKALQVIKFGVLKLKQGFLQVLEF
jgi:outer membrane protein assembly factor BamB